MSKDPKQNEQQQQKPSKKKEGAPQPQAQAKGPVAVDKCKFEDCKKKPQRFGFCEEHYEMYMAGVIRGDGAKPADYIEKLAWYNSKQKKAVA